MSKTDMICEFVEELDFDSLTRLADILDVEHDEDLWLDDLWLDYESELRQSVTDEFLLRNKL